MSYTTLMIRVLSILFPQAFTGHPPLLRCWGYMRKWRDGSPREGVCDLQRHFSSRWQVVGLVRLPASVPLDEAGISRGL